MTASRNPRPLRPHLPDVRPLDRFTSLKIKLAILVAASVTLAALITWVGLRNTLGPSRTFPLAVVISMLFTMLLARGMTSPLREMTAAARSMSEGDYSRRVRATSRDEVGQLATAFNIMAEDLASSDQVRRELIANVSHELRTPVAALHAQLENLVDGVVEPTPATMQTALTQTERLTRLITYLLDLSRIEAGAADLAIRDLDARTFLEDTVDSVSTLEAGKQLTFAVDVEPEGLTLPADAERLRQILVNLLQNAIRHSPFGAEVTVRARTGPGTVVVDVCDQGPGIAKADRQRIFERFARGAGSVQPGGTGSGGTGIGLAIVRWAVDLHGGTVEVADSSHGATMRITLPKLSPYASSDPGPSSDLG
ncbi:HAMP domain-containing sensor histidine kinase [Sanguibacter suaedae]|uniref:Signal transduction histidine-protein kinase/phosphatase MprB n=1 Tax=Sanguibacter suaedae TaxID=2795737 RepID=A0A934MEW0_9MICO|nr:HAMP domain-containing sensor histidine kinase [Sanguibacter suaedae]MBI9116054.1 HAMP domain-containing histidine kinase [Sanguibacter suaedae]